MADHTFSLPLTEDQIERLAASRSRRVAAIAPLSGDASTRRFFRLRYQDGGTLVAMALEGAADPRAHPQFRVGQHLERIGLPVPRLDSAFPEAGLLLYEDLGDRLLQSVARHAGLETGSRPSGNETASPAGLGAEPAGNGSPDALGLEELEGLYGQAIDLILLLQERGTRSLPQDHPSAASALDEERLGFELAFFRKHYIESLRDLRFGSRENRTLDAFVRTLAGAAACGRRVLCHRDFHSRNLLLHEGRLRVVDFQDARLGPVAYDLASLLRDSYVVLPDGMRRRLIERFASAGAVGAPDAGDFARQFDIVSLQRNLKALGTFGYQITARGKREYLPYIPLTWSYVFETLERFPEWSEAIPILKIAAGA